MVIAVGISNFDSCRPVVFFRSREIVQLFNDPETHVVPRPVSVGA